MYFTKLEWRRRMFNFLINPYDRALKGKTITASMKPDKIVGAKDCEYLSGKAGNTNFKICSSKNNGFSLVTDKGYLSVNPEGQVYWCRTVDNSGNERTLEIKA